MMLYVIKAAITLALLYSCFFIFLSKETFHRFNRCMLVGIMLVSLFMPMFHFTTSHPTTLNEEVYIVQNYIEHDTTPIIVTEQQAQGITWIQALTWIYMAGVVLMLILTLVQATSLIRFMSSGVRHTDSQGNTVILHNNDVPPFSIFRYIVMSVKDYESSRQYILTHEQEHIRLGHTYDLLLLQGMKTLMWFNPFIWFLSRDLKAVHEYEADQAVINQGIDAKSYQQLLVMKVVGNRLQPFTNNLNHGSLKKRIVMMYQKPSNRWLMLKALCAIPVAALTINTFATPIETDPVEDMVKTLETTNVPAFNEVKEALPSPKTAEEASEEKPFAITTDSNNIDDNPLVLVNDVEINLPVDIKTITNETIAEALGIQKDDIEGITVLIDNAATTIFGERGKNGVVDIKVVKSAFLNRLPGIQKNEDGSITINGKVVKKILVNGKEFFKALSDDQEIPTIQNAIHDDPIFDIVEEPAQYPGGQAALMQYLAQNIRYPKIAAENGVQGRVLVQFVVEKDGSLSNFAVVKKSGDTITQNAQSGITVNALGSATEESKVPQEAFDALNAEAVRVLREMPKWIPAKQRGQEVRMRYTLPITFRLQ